MNMHFASVADATFKSAMSNLAAAVSVVTTVSGGKTFGLTASSVTSFSAEPPTIAVNINLGTLTGSVLAVGNPLCVNILAGHHRELAGVFAGKSNTKGDDRFAQDQWRLMCSGAPALDGALANIDCFIEEVIERHTHALVIARVAAIAANPVDQPLVYWNRQFGTFAQIA